MKITVSKRTACLQGPRTPFLHCYFLCGYSINPPNCWRAPRLLRGCHGCPLLKCVVLRQQSRSQIHAGLTFLAFCWSLPLPAEFQKPLRAVCLVLTLDHILHHNVTTPQHNRATWSLGPHPLSRSFMAPKQSSGDEQWPGRHRLSLLELRLIQSFLVFQIIIFSNRANHPTEMSVLQYAFTSRCIESWSYMEPADTDRWKLSLSGSWESSCCKGFEWIPGMMKWIQITGSCRLKREHVL